MSQKWINTIRKSTVLCIIAILSTWLYVLGTRYILKQCGFFICFDGVINSLCLAYLFKFGDEYYNQCCHPLEKCCIDILCCCSCFRKRSKYIISREYNHVLCHRKQISFGGAIKLDHDIANNEDDEIILKYTENDFSLSASFKPESNILMKPAVESEIEDSALTANWVSSPSSMQQKKPDLDQLYNISAKTDEVVLLSNSVEDDHDGFMTKEKRTKSEEIEFKRKEKVHNYQLLMPSKIHRKSPSPNLKSYSRSERARSVGMESMDGESERSATFMLLDMTDDDEEDDGYGYEYDEDQVLEEGNEDDVGITDIDEEEEGDENME